MSPVQQARRWAAPWVRHFLHLTALNGFSLAQPVFDLISHNPEFLVSHHCGGFETLLLTFLLVLFPPSLVLVMELMLVHWIGIPARPVKAGAVGGFFSPSG